MPSRRSQPSIRPKRETAEAEPATSSQFRFRWREDDQPTAIFADANFASNYLGQIFIMFGQIEWPFVNLTDEVRKKLEKEGVSITPTITVAMSPEQGRRLGQSLIALHEQWANTQQQVGKQS
jgi:hypothetical protein